MRTRQFGIRSRCTSIAMLMVAAGGMVGLMPAAWAAERAPLESRDRPGAAVDTTGLSGARPGCVPRVAGSMPGPGDVRPEDGGAADPVPRAPRLVEDHTVGGRADTGAGAGETRAFPRGASGGAKANDC